MMRNVFCKISLLAVLLGVSSGCIKNDIPYATVPLSVTSLKVSGQTGESVISEKDRTVTVTLEETANPKKVKVEALTYTENASSTLQVNQVIDLTQDYAFTLSLYQDYVWKIIRNQPIERRATVTNQVGNAVFNENERAAIMYITKSASLKEVKLLDLKLGPVGAAMNGVTEGVPPVEWKQYSNYAAATVRVTYSDFLDEEWTLKVYHSESDVMTVGADGWVNVAWLYGSGMAGKECGFEYKEASAGEWTVVDEKYITFDGGNFHARVPHLKPGTTYECRAYSGDQKAESVSFSTTTEGYIPNMSFEDWHKDGKVLCPWAQDGNVFWDSGNHGSNTLGENNITQNTDEVRPGAQAGSQAAKLASTSIVGVFASGNLFVGEYKSTKGMNGILGFGREFKSYPTRLKGWFKYQTQNISHTDPGFEYLKNRPDTCIVWVALGDWELTTSASGERTAVEIVTSKGKPEKGTYFDKKDPHIIAYGEMTCGKTTEGYQEFTVELDYRATDRKPTSLLIVCSASKYGDYFTGAAGATMWVDDFSLEYDYND